MLKKALQTSAEPEETLTETVFPSEYCRLDNQTNVTGIQTCIFSILLYVI
jgi:hypothetical protein